MNDLPRAPVEPEQCVCDAEDLERHAKRYAQRMAGAGDRDQKPEFDWRQPSPYVGDA